MDECWSAVTGATVIVLAYTSGERAARSAEPVARLIVLDEFRGSTHALSAGD